MRQACRHATRVQRVRRKLRTGSRAVPYALRVNSSRRRVRLRVSAASQEPSVPSMEANRAQRAIRERFSRKQGSPHVPPVLRDSTSRTGANRNALIVNKASLATQVTAFRAIHVRWARTNRHWDRRHVWSAQLAAMQAVRC